MISPSDLFEEHLADLRRSGLSDALIEMMGVRSVSGSVLNKLGIRGNIDSGIEFRYQFRTDPNPRVSRYKLFPPVKKKDGKLKKYSQVPGSAPHPYTLSPVLEKVADISEPLYFIEGEKKTARAVQEGLNAIGLGGCWGWVIKGDWQAIEELQRIPFVDREVKLVFDSDTWHNDDIQQAVYAFARYLEFRGAKVSVVLIPQPTKDKVGFDDYLLDHTLADFHQLKTITLKHPALVRHKDWYERWKQEKQGKTDDGLQGKALNLSDPEPWPELVNGSELLADIAAAFDRFVVLPPHANHIQALWVLHCHSLDAFGVSPILEINSPTPECGKSVNQSVKRRLVPRALTTTSISASGIFRIVESIKPTLCIDEADTFLKLNEDIRGLLNASHFRNDAYVIRVEGDNREPRAFDTFCAKSVALIGNLPATLRSRAITIQMKRKSAKDKVDDFNGHHPYPELEELKRKAWRWSRDNLQAIREANPVLPDGIINRNRNNWFPLFAIAQVAGGEWPDKCRAALLAFEKAKPEEESQRIMLLGDLRKIFEDTKKQHIPTEDILKLLGEMDERPWPEWSKGNPMTAVQLSRLLKPFGIRPKTIRTSTKTIKGYDFADCKDAFERYLPQQQGEESDNTVSEPSHPSQTNEFNELNTFADPSQADSVTAQKSDLSSEKQSNVTGVTGQSRLLTPDERAAKWQQEQRELNDAAWKIIKADHAKRRGLQ